MMKRLGAAQLLVAGMRTASLPKGTDRCEPPGRPMRLRFTVLSQLASQPATAASLLASLLATVASYR